MKNNWIENRIKVIVNEKNAGDFQRLNRKLNPCPRK
jgi:hypothetical protein